MKDRIPSSLIAFTACFLWSTAFVGVKYAIGFAPPLFIAGIRFTLAGLVLIPFSGNFVHYLNECRKNMKVILLVAFLQTFMVYTFFFLSMERIQASTGALLRGSGPLLAALFAHFSMKDDRLSRRKVVSFLLGAAGVAIVSLSGGKGGALPQGSEAFGIFLTLLSSVAGTISNVVVLKYKTGITSRVLTSSQLFIGGLMLLCVAFFVYEDMTLLLPLPFYMALSWLVFISAAGFTLWYYLLTGRREQLTTINIWKFIIPVAGAVLGWVLMPDDSPNFMSVLGMAVVGASVFIFFYKKRAQRE